MRRRVEVACGSCTPHAMLLTALAQHLYHVSMLLCQLECRAGPWGVVPKSRYVRRKHPLYTGSRLYKHVFMIVVFDAARYGPRPTPSSAQGCQAQAGLWSYARSCRGQACSASFAIFVAAAAGWWGAAGRVPSPSRPRMLRPWRWRIRRRRTEQSRWLHSWRVWKTALTPRCSH